MFGFIGAGNMAGAILEGMLTAKLMTKDEVCICERVEARANELRSRLGVRVAPTLEDLARECDMLLLGVKPDAAQDALARMNLEGKALISIAAGWTTEMLLCHAKGARVLRVMPNTPALVGEGMAALSLAHTLTEKEAEFALALFRSLGRAVWVPEAKMEAVIGLSGSGPAYAYLFIEALADGGVEMGLPRATALELAAQTLLGSAKMALATGKHPGALKDMVCSPGGTTIEGVRALEARGFRSAVMEAVVAAAEKAERMKSR